MIIFSIIMFSLINAALMMFSSYEAFLKLQYSGYRIKEFERLFTAADYRKTAFFSAVCLVITLICEVILGKSLLKALCIFIIYACVAVLFIIETYYKKRKKPLAATGRLNRVRLMFCGLTAVCSMLILTAAYYILPGIFVSALSISPLLTTEIALIANTIMLPYEKKIADGFLKTAREKLNANPNIIKIGITGSYGKTGVKNILKNILSVKYKVCASKASFNTPMGLCKTINEDLKNDDEVLIAEMGARYTNDISELTEFIQPDIAVITGVGNQHLETFGSVQKIADEKFKLFDFVAIKKGLIVLNGKSNAVKEKLDGNKNEYFDISRQGCYNVENCVCGADGCRFELNADGKKHQFSTKLLGEHNAENIALCVLVAVKLGVDIESIIKTVSELQPVEHRLQLIEGGDKNTLIIDDSYNASMQSAEASLKVLGSFEGYIKIIITPGIIELGNIQAEENGRLGAMIAETADICITTGINAEAIRNGFNGAIGGQSKKSVYVSHDLDDAVKIANTASGSGQKVILFCNDLP